MLGTLNDTERGEPRYFRRGRFVDVLGAAHDGRWAEVLSHLKDRGININAVDAEGRSALVLASLAGQDEVVRELLARRANFSGVEPPGIWTPLGAAASAGHPMVVRNLLRAGAVWTEGSASGLSALDIACAAGHVDVVQELLRWGADPLYSHGHGEHAVDRAAYFGRIPVLEYLAKAGVDLSHPDRRGLNALHAAALGAQPETAAWLQERGLAAPSVATEILLRQLADPVFERQGGAPR